MPFQCLSNHSCSHSRNRSMRPFLLSILVATAAGSASEPAHTLRVGGDCIAPVGFHDATPSFSWRLPPGIASQSAYRIVAASSADRLRASADLWDSGRVNSARSVWVVYRGRPLGSRQAVHWRVKFWDEQGREAPWSAPARLELGLLETSDWQGRWIRMAPATGGEGPPAVVIESARYGVPGRPELSIDITARLRERLARNQPVVTVNYDLAGGDPKFGMVKELSLVVTRDGRREEITVPENGVCNLLHGAATGDIRPYVPQYLRHEFALGQAVRTARLHVTARGVCEIRLNGSKVGEDFMVPGWTPYGKKIETLTYDVTGQLRQGRNAVAAILGEGWFAGRLGWGERNTAVRHPELLLQLEVTHGDGSKTTVVTDESWRATDDGPLRYSGIYDGEVYDARREMPGWDRTGFDDSGWHPVLAGEVADAPALAPKRHHPVRITRRLPARAVAEPAPGRFVFDLGQNMVGWPVLTIPVRKDRRITVRVAEMLEKDGTLYTANYRNARSTDTYTAAADATVTWHPTFTFHGFRYVELGGFPDGTRPEKDWVTGAVLGSDFGWTGEFTSSHELLNRLHSNITWGLRGNFLDIPTDCPQRDERLGWTGDAQVFAPAALFNAGVHSFFASWLESMRLEQHPDGLLPDTVPNVLDGNLGAPGWADAATVIPWETYVRTGDAGILAENFEMMKAWVGWYEAKAEGGIVELDAYGDWLQPYPQVGGPTGDTPRALIGTAYFAHSAELTARAAGVLGRDDDAERFRRLFTAVRGAFTERFFDAQGKLTTPVETQTGYLLALGFDLLPEELRPQALAHLVRLLDEAGGHLRTGFLGTPLLAPVLDRFGRADLACGALFKETYPSWFFPIHQGATTMWERWNSYSHADGFGDAGMNSFNHYAYGAIGQWMYERIAGLAPDPAHPGYRHFFIQPLPMKPLTCAAATLETPFGIARSSWQLAAGTLRIEAVVPPNTTATLRLPAGGKRALQVAMGGKALAPRIEGGHALCELPPGTHRLVISGWPEQLEPGAAGPGGGRPAEPAG